MTRFVLPLLFLCAAALPAAAQEPVLEPVFPDSLARVRVTQSVFLRWQITGDLLSLDRDNLVLRPDDGGEPVTLPRPAVSALEVSRGKRTPTEGALRLGRDGLLSGAAVGLIHVLIGMGQRVGKGCSDCFVDGLVSDAKVAGRLTVVFGLAGLVAGARNPGERFAPVDLSDSQW